MTIREGTIARAIIDEALAVLRLSANRELARSSLIAGMKRHNIVGWVTLAIADTYKAEEKLLPYNCKNSDNLGHCPKYWS